jgi:ABC-type uncharacterized transport system auxiliary subunit
MNWSELLFRRLRMQRFVLIVLFLFMFAGCGKKEAVTQKTDAFVPTPAPQVTQMEKQEEEGAQVAPPVAIAQEMRDQVKMGRQQEAAVKPIQDAAQIIAENRWGFAAYDPQTGIEELYTSRGVHLGSRRR